jgi:hypothetical protein
VLGVKLGIELEPVFVRLCAAKAGWSESNGISGTEEDGLWWEAGYEEVEGAVLLRRSLTRLGTVEGGGVGRSGCATVLEDGERGRLVFGGANVSSAGSSETDAERLSGRVGCNVVE